MKYQTHPISFLSSSLLFDLQNLNEKTKRLHLKKKMKFANYLYISVLAFEHVSEEALSLFLRTLVVFL